MTISDSDNLAASQAHDVNETPAMTFYGKMLTFSRLHIHTDDLSQIEAKLASMLSNKTSNIPVIIDSSLEQDLPALTELLWDWGLQPIGVVKGVLEAQARAQRLAIFPADGKRIERIVASKKPVAAPQKTTEDKRSENQNASSQTHDTSDGTASATESKADTEAVLTETLLSSDQITSMIYDQLLRSGQSINHVGGDLILTNGVNSGAEAITDNNLHVYGRAQGRLVAGATGDKEARIFCQVFNPSLVSVAGTYCLRDNLPEHVIDKPVQVRFIEGEGLVFTVIDQL